jgi:3-oxoacyl-[acyl-carrier protein] reductase
VSVADALQGTALVTGASRGIGRAIARRLARQGCEVVAVARHLGELEELRGEIESTGGRCRPMVLDVADVRSVESSLRDMEVDVLVNNAGVGVLKPFVELAPEEWQRMIDVNVNALFHVTRAVLPGMMSRGHGHVCTVGSIGGRSAFVGGTCYGATKAFVTSWAESLMLEVRERGVKVSVVMPGSVATEFNDHTVTEADRWKLAAEDVADAVAYVVSTPASVLVHRVEVRTLTSPPKRRG